MIRVTATDDLDRLADRIARDAPRALRADLERAVDRVGRAARASWPVRTGRSRRGLRWGVRGDGDVIEAFVENSEEYADDIVRGGGPPVWQLLVEEPLAAAGERFAAQAPDTIARIAREG